MSSAGPSIDVSLITADSDAQACARMMAGSEPWITLNRGYEASLEILRDASKERYAARAGGEVVGFLILNMGGALAGYIQTVCVAQEKRGQGIGARLMAFAEERIFRDSPNVFLCVSSFNAGARRLYDRLGYHVVGELPDYLVAGHSETLMRKTIGSLSDFRKKAGWAERPTGRKDMYLCQWHLDLVYGTLSRALEVLQMWGKEKMVSSEFRRARQTRLLVGHVGVSPSHVTDEYVFETLADFEAALAGMTQPQFRAHSDALAPLVVPGSQHWIVHRIVS